MFTLITGGQVYDPEPRGEQAILIGYDRILAVGAITTQQAAAFGKLTVIDARGGVVVPGLIDPHQHLTGAGGEQGFGSRVPEVTLKQLALAGITTVVGLLGTDTVTRDLRDLYAKCCQLHAEGVTAYMYTGGFELPPRTLLGSVVDDLVFIDRIIGVGEVALSDQRWIDPTLRELATLVKAAHLGGMITGKAGVCHFHLGAGEQRLKLLNDLLDQFTIAPEQIHITHITRSAALLDEAIALAGRGAFVDMDTIEENIGDWLRYYVDHAGRLDRLTLSSDAHTPKGTPSKLYTQVVSTVRDHGFALEQVLPLVTRNPAVVLKLAPHKGTISAGADADVVVLKADDLAIRHVFARGRQVVREGELVELSEQENAVEAGER